MKHVVFNQKGGVGKSTITCKLAAILASQGQPILPSYLSSSVRIRESHQQARPMIHLDPRHKLSQEFVKRHTRLELPA